MSRDTTEHLGLPLPVEINSLEEDLPRLREALTVIDTELYRLTGQEAALTGQAANIAAQAIALERQVTSSLSEALAVIDDNLHGVADTLDTRIRQALEDQAAAVGGFVPCGVITLWSGAADAVPSGWALCDGGNGTPDLRGRFVLGAGGGHIVGGTGGAVNHSHAGRADAATAVNVAATAANAATTLTTAQMPSHNHSIQTYRLTGVDNNVSSYATAQIGGVYATANTGGGGSHTHAQYDHNHTQNPHDHVVAVGDADVLPPYYALAYIMKL